MRLVGKVGADRECFLDQAHTCTRGTNRRAERRRGLISFRFLKRSLRLPCRGEWKVKKPEAVKTVKTFAVSKGTQRPRQGGARLDSCIAQR